MPWIVVSSLLLLMLLMSLVRFVPITFSNLFSSSSVFLCCSISIIIIITTAEIICAVSNRARFGNFCELIRRTGLDFVLNNMEPLSPGNRRTRAVPVGIVGRAEDGAETTETESEDEASDNDDTSGRALLSKFDNKENGEGLTQNKKKNIVRFLQAISNIPNTPDIPNMYPDINNLRPKNVNNFNNNNNPFTNFDNDNEFYRFIQDFRENNDILQLFTVFVPINDAFNALNLDVISIFNVALNVNAVLLEIGEFHIIGGRAISYGELVCGRSYQMLNNQNSQTECRANNKFQVGPGNRANPYACEIRVGGQCQSNLPQLIRPRNIFASNGIIHTVNDVLIPFQDFSDPRFTRNPTRRPTRSPTRRSPTRRPSDKPSTDCFGVNGVPC